MRRIVRSLPREMDREVRDIEKEGFVLVLPNEIDRMPGDQIGGVPFFHREGLVRVPILLPGPVDLGVVVAVTAEQAPKGVESLSGGNERIGVAKMPFSETGRGIAVLFENLGNRHRVEGKAFLVRVLLAQCAVECYSKSLRVETGQHRCASRTAHRSGGVVVGET